jgi:hypothetical protein
MADGQRHGIAGLHLCTDSFTFSEVLFLQTILKKKFQLMTTIHVNTSKVSGPKPKPIYFRLYIYKHSFAYLNTLVRQYFHPSMFYKINAL